MTPTTCHNVQDPILFYLKNPGTLPLVMIFTKDIDLMHACEAAGMPVYQQRIIQGADYNFLSCHWNPHGDALGGGGSAPLVMVPLGKENHGKR